MSYLLSAELHPSRTVASHRTSVSMALVRSSERRAAERRLHQLEAESLSLALPDGFKVPHPEKPRPQYQPSPPLLLKTLLSITGGAVWGVLARRGLTALTDYPGSYLGGVVWANFTACFVMGMAVNSDKLWELLVDDSEPDVMFAAKGSIPLYVGITTGFCGTCSSFSSFILEAFNKAANTLPATYEYPNHAYGIMEALSVVLAHIGISVSGFHAGRHLGGAVDVVSLAKSKYVLVETATTAVGIAAYVVAIVLTITQKSGTWRLWTFLCVFAPWGAMLRYLMSKRLNAWVPNFPAGTFAANILGCVLLAVFTLLARGKRHSWSPVPLVTSQVGCHALMGLDDGFCGALTTVSTFVVELFGLATPHDYRYGVVLVVVGFGFMVAILGSYNWAVGLGHLVCT